MTLQPAEISTPRHFSIIGRLRAGALALAANSHVSRARAPSAELQQRAAQNLGRRVVAEIFNGLSVSIYPVPPISASYLAPNSLPNLAPNSVPDSAPN